MTAVDIDVFAPILFEAFYYAEDSTDQDQVLRTEYAPRRSTSSDIYDLASAADHCAPRGLHRCPIDHQNRVFVSAYDVFIVPSGSYLVDEDASTGPEGFLFLLRNLKNCSTRNLTSGGMTGRLG